MSNEAHKAITTHLSAHEVWEVRTFRAHTESGEIIVELSDSGVDGPLRYYAVAFDPSVPADERGVNNNGRSQGNPGSTVDEAIGNLHSWVFKGA